MAVQTLVQWGIGLLVVLIIARFCYQEFKGIKNVKEDKKEIMAEEKKVKVYWEK